MYIHNLLQVQYLISFIEILIQSTAGTRSCRKQNNVRRKAKENECNKKG